MTWLVEFFYWLPGIVGTLLIVFMLWPERAEPSPAPPADLLSDLPTWRCQPPASHFFQGSTECECQQIRHGGENR